MAEEQNVLDLYEVDDWVENPKAVLLLTHGLGEHLHRYDDWVRELKEADISVFRYDLPGHGQSRRGEWLFKDFDILNQAIEQEFLRARNYCQQHSIPLFLFGHSLGGLITASFVSEYQPEATGVILSAPAMDPGDIVSPFLRKVAGIAQKLVPTLPVLKLPAEYISKDPEIVRLYKEDPLVYQKKISVKTGYAMLKQMEKTRNRADGFKVPLLMLQGDEDKLVRPEMVQSYYDSIRTADKTYLNYDGAYHELLNSLQKARVKEDILEWIQNRW